MAPVWYAEKSTCALTCSRAILCWDGVEFTFREASGPNGALARGWDLSAAARRVFG